MATIFVGLATEKVSETPFAMAGKARPTLSKPDVQQFGEANFYRLPVSLILVRKLKWAASQEAVTFPWLSAHSILKRIGGDINIVNPEIRLSRTIFLDPKLASKKPSSY
ncbi:MAG: hypothetical protein DMG80_10905 [Acidobacteria bacterium]|nr:MAG: hypothetical protein DMG80_10905 [Acidobacteriota bacterium]